MGIFRQSVEEKNDSGAKDCPPKPWVSSQGHVKILLCHSLEITSIMKSALDFDTLRSVLEID